MNIIWSLLRDFLRLGVAPPKDPEVSARVVRITRVMRLMHESNGEIKYVRPGTYRVEKRPNQYRHKEPWLVLADYGFGAGVSNWPVWIASGEVVIVE